jgi:O-antigen ligase
LPAFVLLLFLSPRLGILVWIVAAPFAPHVHLAVDLGGGIPNLDVTRLAVLVLAFQIASGVILGTGRRIRVTWTDGAMVAYIGAMLLSLLGSHLGLLSGVQTIFDFVVIPLCAYWFARHWLRSESDLNWAATATAVVGVALSVITVREQITGMAVFSPVPYSLIYEGKIRKVLSVFGSPAAMTTALTVGVPLLLLGIRRATGPKTRIGLGLALMSVLAGIFFAYVRAGWLGAVACIALMIWLSPQVRKALAPLLPMIVLVGVALVGLTAISAQTVGGRLSSEEPITYRLTAWRIAWDIFRRSPIVGVGYGQFGLVAAQEFGWNPFSRLSDMPSPHNSFFDVAVQGGLLAIVPYRAIFAGLAWQGLRAWVRSSRRTASGVRDTVATLWATLLAYVLIIATFDILNSQYANILFFTVMGTLVGRLEAQTEEAR